MKKKRLDIIYEDKYILVVNKPAGLLTISTEKDNIHTLYHQVREYLNKKNQKVFIVHRLDKDTSGLIVFAKTLLVKNKLQNNWNNVKREYITVVNGEVIKKKDTIKSYLKEDKYLKVKNNKYGKIAITEYEVLYNNNKYTLLKIRILTGRKNQIRVQLKNIGHQIVGDKKYGSIKNKEVNRLCLHANKIEFIHPVTNNIICLENEIPNVFLNLIK